MNKKIFEFRSNIIRISISSIMLLLSFLNIRTLGFDLSWIAILLCAIPLIYNAIKELLFNQDIKADLLVSIAIISSILIGEIFAAAEIAVIMEIGALLEEFTVSTTQSRIDKLAELQPTLATRINNGVEEKVNALNLETNNIIKILPGETIPADGIIIEGNTTVNQALLTGESAPITKIINDEVCAGTINNYGAVKVRVTTNGKNNSLQKLINLIESVNTDDSKITRQADKWANLIVFISFTTAILTWLYTGEIINAVTVLVVFCPCALVLATPTALIAAIGNLSKYGILVKNTESLESLFKIDNIIFDKTGTITTGIPKVVKTINKNEDEKEFLKITASVESYSEHPIAKTIISYYNEKYGNEKLYDVPKFKIELGRGITGKINGKKVLVGNNKLFEKYNLKLPNLENIQEKFSSSSVIYSCYDKKLLGILFIQDTPRKGMKTMMNRIKYQGYTPILLTGDNELVAKDIAKQVNISKVKADCLPKTKLEFVKNKQKEFKKVIMIGDGINDASALKKANVGIAMGDVGSDITISSADMVFINDDIKYLPYLLYMSKKTLNTINLGISFSLILNTIAMVLSIIGVLNPITGALIHNVGSVLVIIFAASLFRQKPDDYVKDSLEII